MSLSSGFRLFVQLSAVLMLAGCGSITSLLPSPLLGKWEVVSGPDIGMLYEFFPNGAVSVGGLAGKYSWPDQSHVELDVGRPVIYTYTASGDELGLTNSSLDRVLVLKKYKELSLSPENLSGPWKLSAPRKSRCFEGLGIDKPPQELVLRADGWVGMSQSSPIVGAGMRMTGRFLVTGHRLKITASGTQGLVSTDWLGKTTIEQVQLNGEFECDTAVSYSRLTFSDTDGQGTVFVRAEKP